MFVRRNLLKVFRRIKVDNEGFAGVTIAIHFHFKSKEIKRISQDTAISLNTNHTFLVQTYNKAIHLHPVPYLLRKRSLPGHIQTVRYIDSHPKLCSNHFRPSRHHRRNHPPNNRHTRPPVLPPNHCRHSRTYSVVECAGSVNVKSPPQSQARFFFGGRYELTKSYCNSWFCCCNASYLSCKSSYCCSKSL